MAFEQVTALIYRYYYWLDLTIGFGLPFLLYLHPCRSARRDRRLFWLGAALGLSWEIPVFLLSAFSTKPIIVWLRPLPCHFSVFLISHTLWDGMIFLVGLRLAGLFVNNPLGRFRWIELLVLIAWGQMTALLVEISSVLNDAWVYREGYRWNPTWLHFEAGPITALMQIVWFVAPFGYYLIALKYFSAKKVD